MSKKSRHVEKLISEELQRFEGINKYIDPIEEQFLGLGGQQATFQLEEQEGEDQEEEVTLDFGGDNEEETTEPTEEGGLDLGGEDDTTEPTEETEETTDTDEGNVEELDVTELVTMAKESGEKTETLEKSIGSQKGSIDSLIAKLDDLEKKLNDMDSIVSSVEELETKFEKYRPQTPQEKLELRYLDSGPFNQKPTDYWQEKTGEMAKQKDKHEYVLTQQEVDDYNEADIKKSWIYDEDDPENN
jgi:hypothetical protein